MEGNDGDFDGKGQEKGGIDPALSGGAQMRLHQLGICKGVDPGLRPMDEVEGDQGHQHQEAAAEGEQGELDGGVHPPFVAPDADHEEHGNDLDFPEQVKQEEIGG